VAKLLASDAARVVLVEDLEEPPQRRRPQRDAELDDEVLELLVVDGPVEVFVA